MRDLGAADGGYQLGTHFDDSGVLGFGSDHEPGNIVKEDDWSVLLVADSYKGCGLDSLVGVYDRDLVCHNTDGMSFNWDEYIFELKL